uniref:Ferredoxin-dependent glutamate synthase family protein n=1 Tax=Rhizophora mucronata TaxID=61149 RepID=A0A2P2LRV2_RHIMU
MALQSSVTSIPHLLFSPTAPTGANSNSFFLVDFVGLYCKSKKTRRRIGVSSSSSWNLIRYANKNSWSTRANLGATTTTTSARLERVEENDGVLVDCQDPQPAALRPKVYQYRDSWNLELPPPFFFWINLRVWMYWPRNLFSIVLSTS